MPKKVVTDLAKKSAENIKNQDAVLCRINPPQKMVITETGHKIRNIFIQNTIVISATRYIPPVADRLVNVQKFVELDHVIAWRFKRAMEAMASIQPVTPVTKGGNEC